jgi:predicted MFS family arabinose efflux permease
MGWRLPFFAVAAMALAGLLAMLRWLPAGMAQAAGGKASTQLAALADRHILTMMAVTTLGFGSIFAAFTYVTPILTDIAGFSATMASALLIVFGAATFAGNLAGGYLSSHMGWQRSLRMLLVLLAVTHAGLAVSLHTPWALVPLLFLWGMFSFGLSPGLQAGMLATAEHYTPKAVDFASGLNISAFNFGISLGSSLGGLMVARSLMGATPWAGVAISLAALVPLAWLARRPIGVPAAGASGAAAAH